MQNELVKHTLDIFERLCDDLPPLLPADMAKDMQQGLEQMQNNVNLTIEELEETMISFGKKIWPYRRAFQEFVDLHEGRIGEKFLLGKLAPQMKKRYEAFKQYGGTFRDLHSGAPATFFHEDERGSLCTALIEVHGEVRDYTRQSVLSTEREHYEQRIVEFQVILDDIEKRLDTLRIMADNEQEHPDLAAEIRDQINAFEQGLCLLAARTEYTAVCQSAGHFEGRKAERRLMPFRY